LLSPRSQDVLYDELHKQINPLFAKEDKPVKSSIEPDNKESNNSNNNINNTTNNSNNNNSVDVNNNIIKKTVADVVVAVPSGLSDGPILKQAMTRDGQFLVIPTNDAESLAFAKV
jgi:hypothetical protein